MSESTSEPMVKYEPPTVTLYGDIAELTNGVSGTRSDAQCATVTLNVPSNVVCKTSP
jgi:hypothetical protein